MKIQPDIQTTESGRSFLNWTKGSEGPNLDASVAILNFNWTVLDGTLDLTLDSMGKSLGGPSRTVRGHINSLWY